MTIVCAGGPRMCFDGFRAVGYTGGVPQEVHSGRAMSRGYTDSPDAGDGESAGRVRVVILSSAAFGDGEPDIPGVECVRAAGSYEAAAELLAAPAAALVVDLRRLTGRHIRLLEIARGRARLPEHGKRPAGALFVPRGRAGGDGAGGGEQQDELRPDWRAWV